MRGGFLLDTNVLIALTEPGHQHHEVAQDWLNRSAGQSWGFCPLTEAGFLRVVTNSRSYPSPRPLAEAVAILRMVKAYPHFRFWEMKESWVALTASFAARVLGHRQITDAYLLGMAIEKDGLLVTFDKDVRYMAGSEFSRHVCLLGE